jgi:hypothetical protein
MLWFRHAIHAGYHATNADVRDSLKHDEIRRLHLEVGEYTAEDEDDDRRPAI